MTMLHRQYSGFAFTFHRFHLHVLIVPYRNSIPVFILHSSRTRSSYFFDLVEFKNVAVLFLLMSFRAYLFDVLLETVSKSLAELGEARTAGRSLLPAFQHQLVCRVWREFRRLHPVAIPQPPAV